jgi:hypothetical protein
MYQSIVDPKFNEIQVIEHLFIFQGNQGNQGNQYFDHGNINQLNIFCNIARINKRIYDQHLSECIVEWFTFGVTTSIFASCIVLKCLWQIT